MNARTILLAACLVAFSSSGALWAGPVDEELRSAIELSNQGRRDEALRLLRKLSAQAPSDERVFLSLGMVCRSLGLYEESVAAFERAVQIKPSEEGFYSLGLLYEGMANNHTDKPALLREWRQKAADAWTRYLRLNPGDSKKREVAERHLKNLTQQLSER